MAKIISLLIARWFMQITDSIIIVKYFSSFGLSWSVELGKIFPISRANLRILMIHILLLYKIVDLIIFFIVIIRKANYTSFLIYILQILRNYFSFILDQLKDILMIISGVLLMGFYLKFKYYLSILDFL